MNTSIDTPELNTRRRASISFLPCRQVHKLPRSEELLPSRRVSTKLTPTKCEENGKNNRVLRRSSSSVIRQNFLSRFLSFQDEEDDSSYSTFPTLANDSFSSLNDEGMHCLHAAVSDTDAHIFQGDKNKKLSTMISDGPIILPKNQDSLEGLLVSKCVDALNHVDEDVASAFGSTGSSCWTNDSVVVYKARMQKKRMPNHPAPTVNL